jgi:hypothetical protein
VVVAFQATLDESLYELAGELVCFLCYMLFVFLY